MGWSSLAQELPSKARHWGKDREKGRSEGKTKEKV